MIRPLFLFLVAGVGSCATLPETPQPHLAQISRGPCFGFCPVYDLKFVGDRRVDFTGIRHTAFLGSKSVEAPALRDALERALAFARPQGGSSDFPCNDRVTDQATYHVVWTQPGGSSATLDFSSGCGTPEAAQLKQILESAVERAGFGAEAAQITRPGVPRG